MCTPSFTQVVFGLLCACRAVLCLFDVDVVSVHSIPLHTGSVGLLCACAVALNIWNFFTTAV